MPDISMCTSRLCPVAGRCYRNPQSGTKPEPAQTWAPFWPENGEQCEGYWPKSAPASDVDVSRLESDEQPTADELASAPILDGWRIFAARSTDDGSLHFVVGGHVSGRDGSKIRTSSVAKIDADRRWVRTQNTLYLLGSRNREMSLALQAATASTWTSALALTRISTGGHTVLPWVMAGMVSAGDQTKSWPRRRAAAAAVGDEMSRAGRPDIAGAWWNLSADPANRSDAEYVYERLVAAAGPNPSPEIQTVIAGWGALARGLDHDVDLSDSVAAARQIGERVGGEFVGTDAFRELKIDIDGPSAIDALKPAAEPEPEPASGVVVLAAIGGTTVTSVGKEVHQEFKAILSRRLPLAVADGIADVRTTLRNEFPHLYSAIDVLLSDFVEGEPLRLRPTLLVGPPGGGKSRLARRLAECLQVGLHRYDAAGASDNTFGGTPRRWSSGEHSTPLEAARRYRIANPWILVDEIDKAGTSRHNGSLANSLMPFLETETAARYPDPFVQTDIDLSHVGYILTANDDTLLPAPLRDRLRIVRLPEPTLEHLIPLTRAIITEIATVNGVDRRWYPDFSDDEISIAAQLWRNGSIRRLRAIVERMLAHREQNPRN